MTVALNEPITAEALSLLLGCSAPKTDTVIRYVVTDAREAVRDALFCALPGHVTDGHRFIPQAVANGCTAVLCVSLPDNAERIRCPDGTAVAFLATGDVSDALFRWSATVRRRFSGPVIAVTGSVGKTTCKEFLCALLSPLGTVFSTPGNHNSTIGVPLSLLRLGESDRAAVVELGMNHAGEISALSELVRPDAAVITAVGRAHIGLLGSEEAIFRAKCEITDGMSGGPVWIPAQDRRFDGWEYPHKITFGDTESGADCRYRYLPTPGGSHFSLAFTDGGHLRGELPFAEPVTVEAALRAAAVAHETGLSDEDLQNGLAHLVSPSSRMEKVEYDGVTLLNDAYNAAPEAMAAALACLGKYRHRRKLAVLGEMGELGAYAEDIHYEIGQLTASAHPSHVWYRGRYADAFLRGAGTGGLTAASVTVFGSEESLPEIADVIRSALRPGDVLLIKGAHGTGLYRLAPLILQKKE